MTCSRFSAFFFFCFFCLVHRAQDMRNSGMFDNALFGDAQPTHRNSLTVALIRAGIISLKAAAGSSAY